MTCTQSVAVDKMDCMMKLDDCDSGADGLAGAVRLQGRVLGWEPASPKVLRSSILMCPSTALGSSAFRHLRQSHLCSPCGLRWSPCTQVGPTVTGLDLLVPVTTVVTWHRHCARRCSNLSVLSPKHLTACNMQSTAGLTTKQRWT